MGLSHKSKRTDKETQSPVLKIFKDIMQKEKRDPEQTNLLAAKVERKRNHKKWKPSKSSSKPKYDQVINNSSTHSEDQSPDVRGCPGMNEYEIDTQNSHFYDEKKENYCCWREKAATYKSEDTYSRVSCALKKIIGSDYSCIICLGLLFAISVFVAFCLVYKSIPCLGDNTEFRRDDVKADRNRRNFLMKKWDDSDSSNHGVPQSMDIGADLASLVDSDSELSKILDNEKMNEIQSSERLREFYKKLIDADTAIQQLKKSKDFTNTETGNYKTYPERAKRSLSILKKPMKLFHFNMNKKKIKPTIGKVPKDITKNKLNQMNKKPKENVAKDHSRSKRFDKNTKGFVIERKNILIQYQPIHSDTSRKSKCSHAPKDSKSHEHELKHPFYQNTQRLDELLDKLLFGIDTIDTAEEKDTNNCKHPRIDDMIKENHPEATTKDNDVKDKSNELDIDKMVLKSKIITPIQKNTMSDFEFIDAELKKDESSTNTYDVLMSISTNLYDKSILKRTNSMIERVPNIRRLLQADSDDNQNMPEESVDPKDSDDNKDSEHDREVERKKRMNYESNLGNKLLTDSAKALNQNWKSLMPQEEYPHALSPMFNEIRTIVNTIETPAHIDKTNIDKALHKGHEPVTSEINIKEDEDLMNSKDSPIELDEFETELTDMEYIEDYFHKKYKRLDGLAQAYSDYGVLEGKSGVTEKNEDKNKPAAATEHKISLSLNGFKEGVKNSIFGRPKKGDLVGKRSPLDFRFEIRPSTSNDDSMDILESIRNHIKIGPLRPSDNLPTPVYIDTPAENKRKVKKSGNNIIVNKGRALKAVEFEDNYDYKDNDGEADTFQLGRLNIKHILEAFHIIFKREVNTNELKADNDVGNNIKTNETVVSNHEHDYNLSNRTEYNLTNNDTMHKVKEGEGLDYDNLIHSNKTKDSEEKNGINLFKAIRNTSNVKFKREVGVNNFETTHKNVTKSDMSVDHTVLSPITSKPTDKLYFSSKSNNTRNASINNSTWNDNNMVTFYNNILVGDSNDTGLSLSDFFMVMSKWFLNMDAAEKEKNTVIQKPSRQKTKESQDLNETIEITFPMYDSDMIENIGHRSRVLLSVDNNATQLDEKEQEITKLNDSVDKITNITNILTSNENETKNIVKRNAEDSNLIYWNDIYDDEYGVAEDKFQNGDTQKENQLNSIAKTGNKWFKDKVRFISDKFQNKAKSLRREFGDAVKNKKDKIHGKASTVTHKFKEEIEKRAARSIAEEMSQPRESMKSSFAVLTRKMKDVCRKAAQDVRQAKKIHAREETKDDQAASSLMKKLVYLMSDVVDYQVEQRTCRKLPPDLQNYLEWLTATETEDAPRINTEKVNDMYADTSKMNSFDILQAVQDLVKQYDLMSDDEKSKMLGVRDYLDRQIHFIQEQLASVNDYSFYDSEQFRYRRDTNKNTHHTHSDKNQKQNLKQNEQKHDKNDQNNTKQHDKKNGNSNNDKTANHSNAKAHSTDVEKHNKKADEKKSDSKTKEKKNLRDVYYKAVEDAKKITTSKQ